MPKLKRSSSSQASSKAKKQRMERLQVAERRQKDLGHTSDGNAGRRCEGERRLRNTEARRIAHLDPQRRQEEQIRDSAARRRLRLEDAQRRQEEQARDTAARQRVRLEDPERRQEEQARDTPAHRLVREDPIRRMEEQQQNMLQHREARSDQGYRTQEQQINNARRQQVRAGRQANFRALNYHPDNFFSTTNVGLLSVECQKCGALKFSKETVAQKAMLC